MKIRTTLAVAILAVMGSTAAMAQSRSADMPLTRAEVRQSFIDARHAGELTAGGNADEYTAPKSVMPSGLQRSAVQADVHAALASGSWAIGGNGDEAFFTPSHTAAASTLTRADVKLATLQARDAGALFSAGNGDASELARESAQGRDARMAYLARKAMPIVASN